MAAPLKSEAPGSTPAPKVAEVLAAALAYAAAGWPPFALAAGAKTPAPRCANGFKSASTAPEELRAMFSRPCNVGIAVPSGFVVVDVDSEDARDSLREAGLALPDTARQRTPRGWHYVYALPDGVEIRQTASEVLPGVDTRTGGKGYIVAAPSVVSGRAYEWERPLARESIAPAPPWLLDRLSTTSRRRKATAAKPALRLTDPAPEGARNETIFRAACAVRRTGATDDAVRDFVRLSARNARPALDDREAERIADSVLAESSPGGLADLAATLAGSSAEPLPLRGVNRRNGRFELVLDDDVLLDLGPIENALDPRAVARALYRQTGRAPKLDREGWHRVAETIFALSTEVLVLSERDELLGWIRSAMRSRDSRFGKDWAQLNQNDRKSAWLGFAITDWTDHAPAAFVDAGRLLVEPERLRSRLALASIRLGVREISALLTKYGFRRKRLAFVYRAETEGGVDAEVRLRCYVGPLELLDDDRDGGDDEA